MKPATTPEPKTKTVGYFGVFISLLLTLLLTPVFANSHFSFILLQTCFVLLLTSLSYSLSNHRWVVVTGAWVVLLFITLDNASIYTENIHLMVISYCIFILFLMFTIFLLLKVIFKAPVIDNNLIFGALAVYLLIGILWGKLYFLTGVMFPGSFHGLTSPVHESTNIGANFNVQFDLLYYSFTTLSTLGMGDVSPLRHLAKALTILEAMFGQLFVAIVIAKLVSVWRRPD